MREQNHKVMNPINYRMLKLQCKDDLFVFAGLIRYLNSGFNVDIPPDQLTYCTWSTAVGAMTSQTSIYLIVVMTFERFYSILRPHKAALFNTVKRAKITILCIILLSIVYNLPHLFVTSVSGRTCVYFLKGMKYLAGRIYYWVNQAVGFGIPFISLLIMNCVIIYNLHKRSKFLTNKSDSLGEGQDQDKGQGHRQGHKNTRHQEKQIITMLLIVTFSFLILMIPVHSMLFYTQFVDFRSSPKLYTGFHLLSAMTDVCYNTNFGINFYLYVISGQKFRSDLIGLFRKMLPCTLNKTISGKAELAPSICTRSRASLSVECSTKCIN